MTLILSGSASTADKLELVLSVAADIDWVLGVAVADVSGTQMVPKDTFALSGNITGTGANTLATPTGGVGIRWSIGSVEVRNKHATVSTDATLRHAIGAGASRELKKVTLAPGDSLTRNKDGTWFKYDGRLGVYTVLSTPMTITTLVSGSSTYTTPAGCRAIWVRMWGGGSGGGGVTGAASSAGAGAGGGSGGYTEKLLSPPASSYAYAIGAGGAGGAAGANAGSVGADTTFGSLTAKGAGSGGAGQATGTTAAVANPGAGGVAGSGGDINVGGTEGKMSYRTSGTVALSGAGGSSHMGGGGAFRTTTGAGNNADGNSGGGGGGALSLVAGSLAGGNGAAGQIIIQEFY